MAPKGGLLPRRLRVGPGGGRACAAQLSILAAGASSLFRAEEPGGAQRSSRRGARIGSGWWMRRRTGAARVPLKQRP